MKKILHILLSLLIVFLPFAALAQTTTTTGAAAGTTAAAPAASQFASDGIFGCNRTSAGASSVAVFAGSGTYVPVNDAAVTLNTGYLVYLYCTLNPLVSALSASATAGLVQKILTAFNAGNSGNAQYSVNINNENFLNASSVSNTAANAYLQSGALNSINPAIQGPVQTSVARGYAQSLQQPSAVLGCSVTNLSGLLNGTPSAFNWNDFNTLVYNPACNAMGATQLTSNQFYNAINTAVQNNMTQLQWGQGVYPVVDQNGNVLTPGSVVLNQAQQALQSGLYKTEIANSVGQLVGSLFAGIGAQAVSSAQGVTGITQATGGQPSYISQVASQAATAVQSSAANAAITTVNGVLQTIESYINELNTTANTLLGAANSLRNVESECWNVIIQNVCTAGSFQYTTSGPTCTEVGSGVTQTVGTGATGTTVTSSKITLTIATSTAFSNAVIQSQLNPIGATIGTQLQAAQNIQAEIQQIATGVSNTTSQDAQSLALEQLDQITACTDTSTCTGAGQTPFPQQSDLQNAQSTATTISTSMQTLVTQVTQNWQGVDSNGVQDLPWDGTVSANTVGWCNYNNTPTLQAWENIWSKATS